MPAGLKSTIGAFITHVRQHIVSDESIAGHMQNIKGEPSNVRYDHTMTNQPSAAFVAPTSSPKAYSLTSTCLLVNGALISEVNFS